MDPGKTFIKYNITMTKFHHFDLMQSLWLDQLQLEYDEICRTYNLVLEPPLFEITDGKKIFGAYHPATRTLQLSRQLITHFSWSVTLEVLKHEMAHQLCHEYFQMDGAPHGQVFQQACQMLGVLPEYRRAGVEVTEIVKQATGVSAISARGRECMAKVEKLLALSHSSNEHEAALAMQKANQLIEKYHLGGLGGEQRDRSRYGFGVIDRKRKRIEGYQRRICTILQDFFFVRVVLASLYDPMRDETYKTIELMGTKENVTIAEYCYHFLENKLASLWTVNKKRFRGSTRTEKNSYYLGLLRGFYQQLEGQKKGREKQQVQVTSGELALAEEKRLETFVAMRFPRLRKAAKSGVKIYGTTYKEGVTTGKNISFAEGLAGSASGGGLLPG